MNRLRSVRSILILAFTISLLVPMVLVLFYAHSITGRSLASQALDAHVHDVVLQAQHIEQSLSHIREDAAYLTRLRSLRQFALDTSTRQQLEQDLVVFATAKLMIQQIVVQHDTHRIGIDNSSSTPRLIDADVLVNAAYSDLMIPYEALSVGQTAISFDLLWNQAVLRYVLGTESGLILVDVDAGWIFRNLPDVESNRIWAILSQHGRHLLLPLPNEHYEGAIAATDMALADYLPQFQADSSGTTLADSNVFIHSHIYPTGQSQSYWILYQQVPQSDLFRVVKDFNHSSSLIFGVAIMIMMLVGTAIAETIIRPIQRLQQRVRQFAIGKPLSEMPRRLAISELDDLHQSFTQMASQLGRERYEKKELIKKLITAQEDERKRIAYDLHDGLIQQLVGAKMYVAMLKERVDSDLQRDVITCEDALKEAVLDGRRIIQGLHPTILDDLGLVDAIAELAQQQAKLYGWDLAINLAHLSHEPHKSVSITVFRIVQEALNNIAKHAHANRVQIHLSNGNGIQLTITDDGVGFNPHADDFHAGLGIGTMRERATSLDGDCNVVSSPMHGTKITLNLPFD